MDIIMSDELKAQLELLSSAVDDLKLKLEGIDKLLGAPYANEFSEQVLSGMTDDILKYNMMLTDIYAFASRRVNSEFKTLLIKHIEERMAERLKQRTQE